MFVRIAAFLAAIIAATSAFGQTDYRVGPGDQLLIEVLEDSALNRNVLVLPDGSFSFPLAGAISAGGRTTTQVAQALTDALSPNFAASPTVSVSVASVGQRAPVGGGVAAPVSSTVYFLGEVNNPGALEVERGTTVLQALALTGGFTRFAATKRVQLRRMNSQTGQEIVSTINFRAIENGQTGIGNTVLADGDVIVVPERRLFE